MARNKHQSENSALIQVATNTGAEPAAEAELRMAGHLGVPAASGVPLAQDGKRCSTKAQASGHPEVADHPEVAPAAAEPKHCRGAQVDEEHGELSEPKEKPANSPECPEAALAAAEPKCFRDAQAIDSKPE